MLKLEAYKVAVRSNNNKVEVVESRIDMGSYSTVGELEKAKEKHKKDTANSYRYWIEGAI